MWHNLKLLYRTKRNNKMLAFRRAFRRSRTFSSQPLRKSFVMSVDSRFVEEYKNRHDALWPELKQTLLDHGVTNYSIHHHPTTNQLFAYAEVTDEVKWTAIADTEICKKWWKHMADIMPSNSDNSPVAIDLKEMFHITAK